MDETKNQETNGNPNQTSESSTSDELKESGKEEAQEMSGELSPDELMAQQFASAYEEEDSSTQPDLEDLSYPSNVEVLLDIPLEVTVEVGSTQMLIEDVLKLNPNSVIELDRFINEPVDLKVNGRVIAKGELYTVKNNFGIKITQIVTPEERLKLLDI